MEISIDPKLILDCSDKVIESHMSKYRERYNEYINKHFNPYIDSEIKILEFKKKNWFFSLFFTKKDEKQLQNLKHLSDTEKIDFVGKQLTGLEHFERYSIIKDDLDFFEKIEQELSLIKKITKAATHAFNSCTLIKLKDYEIELFSDFISYNKIPYR